MYTDGSRGWECAKRDIYEEYNCQDLLSYNINNRSTPSRADSKTCAATQLLLRGITVSTVRSGARRQSPEDRTNATAHRPENENRKYVLQIQNYDNLMLGVCGSMLVIAPIIWKTLKRFVQMFTSIRVRTLCFLYVFIMFSCFHVGLC